MKVEDPVAEFFNKSLAVNWEHKLLPTTKIIFASDKKSNFVRRASAKCFQAKISFLNSCEHADTSLLVFVSLHHEIKIHTFTNTSSHLPPAVNNFVVKTPVPFKILT